MPIRRMLLLFLASMSLTMAAGEAGVRLVDDRLPDPLAWYDARNQVLIELLDQRGADDAPDVVFAGTSMVIQGVDPALFTAADPAGRRGFNAGSTAATTPVVARWLVEEILPRAEPGLVVYGLSSLDLNANRPEPTIDRYDDARAARRSVLGRLDWWLARHSAVFHHRSQLNTPSGLLDVVRDDVEDPLAGARAETTPDGYRTRHPSNVTDAEATRLRRKVLHDYAIDESMVDALRRSVRGTLDSGAAMVLVWMPVPQRYLALHDDPADFEQARDTVAAVAAEFEIDFIDLSRLLADDAFGDYTHTTRAGTEILTRRLVDELEVLGL